MGEVISMNRVTDTEEKTAVENLKDFLDQANKEYGYERFALIACPEDMAGNFQASFATNFGPGVYELIALEALLDHCRRIHIEITEEG